MSPFDFAEVPVFDENQRSRDTRRADVLLGTLRFERAEGKDNGCRHFRPLLSIRLVVVFSLPGSLQAETANVAVPVYVNLVRDDGLTQKLASELRKKIPKQTSTRLARVADRDPFSIVSLSNVEWDILSGRRVAIYRVQLAKGGTNIVEISGVCYESDITKYAKNIVIRLDRVMRVERQ